MNSSLDAETLTSFLGGRISLVQPKHGYRFSVDSVLLARFARARERDRMLDLGAGCGVIAILIAALSNAREVVAVEVQPAMAAMIARNARINRLEQVSGVCADLSQAHISGLAPGTFDLVVANPPYRARRSGRESPNPSRRTARGSTQGSLSQFVTAAAHYARYRGRVAMVFTAARSGELMAELRSHSLEPKRIRFVHPRLDLPASSILVEARKGGGVEASVEPPLVMCSKPGVYTAEAAELMSGWKDQ